MLKLLKYLKRYALHIVFIVILLLIQAASDLSLPDYMSDIVNIGIQQAGIENAALEVIRESEYEKVSLLLNDVENKLFTDNYMLVSVNNSNNLINVELYNNFLKKYSLLKEENLYVLNTKDQKTLDQINIALSKSFLFLLSDGKVLPDMPQSMITQSSIAYVKNEYMVIGIDLNRLQSRFIFNIGGLMLLVALLSMLATIAVGFLAARVAAGLGRGLRDNVFRKVTTFSNSEFDSFSTASLITRSTNDIQQVQTLMVMLLRVVFYAPIVGVGGIIKALSTNTSMAWIIAVGLMAILTLVTVLFSIAMPRFKKVQKLVDKVNLIIRESLVGMLVIRAFNTERYEEDKFDKTNVRLTKTNLFVSRIMATMMPLMMLIMNGVTLLIIWVGAKQIDLGTLQVGDMMAFMQYTMQIMWSFLMISMVSIMFPRASVSAQRIVEVIDTHVDIEDSPMAQDLKVNINAVDDSNGDDNINGLIEFINVWFKYPGADECVLKNISFTAVPGQTTAFIGSTGSGKSTLINLIPRFYDVADGEVLVDGINVKDLKLESLRRQIGYVPQKGVLFSGTIESNIKYGKVKVSDDYMRKVANIAQAEDFILQKEDGFLSNIAQGGSNVSGGQKQRLSIARALAKKPKIFIFDDSFSALDYKTDVALRTALKDEVGHSTVLIVAQRISTILNAEKIIVLDEGNIVGEGTHNELLRSCTVYREIAQSQLSEEELS